MTDVESRQQQQQVNNPYNSSNAAGALQPIRSRYHPMNILSRGMWMSLSLYILHRMNVYTTIMTSPDISHEWFKVGLAASVALLLVKAYVELYTGKIQKKAVNYQTMKQETHVSIFLLLVSGIAFQIALWPVYGGNSMFIMFIVSVFLLNFCLMFPTIVQNIVAFAILTFFLQEYK